MQMVLPLPTDVFEFVLIEDGDFPSIHYDKSFADKGAESADGIGCSHV